MKRKNAAFTLVELMIAMAVGLVVLGAVYTVFTTQNKLLGNQEQLAELHQNARTAMDLMVREISMAGYNQTSALCTAPVTPVPRCAGTATATNTPCVGITNAGANTISFTADLNSNCETTPNTSNPNENITFSLYFSNSIKTLGRNSNLSTRQPVVEYAENLQFDYYDDAGAVTSNLNDIRRVKITFTARTAKADPNYTHPTSGDHYHRYTLSSFAFPRNMALSAPATTLLTTSAATSVTSTIATTTVPPTTSTTTATTSTTIATTSVASSTTTVAPTTTTTISGGGSTINSVTQTPSGGTVPRNTGVTVCATVTDADATAAKLITNQDAAPITMTLSAGRYCGTIPKHNNRTVNYHIETYDSSGILLDESADYSYNQSN
jgi:prepilin-type N-terminal cleavage/methylation domain-containing protein